MTPSEFPVYDQPVGVLVSGGADSALMLYCVLTKCTGPIHVFTITNNPKGLENPKACLDVIQKCIELTGNNNIEHHIFYRESQQKSDFYGIPDLYRSRGLVDKVFIGITANPPAEILDTFNLKQTSNILKMRDPTVTREEFPDSGFILPWTNVDKKQIAEYYRELNLIDSLYPITRSCECDYPIGKKSCGVCWWCEERLWAFGKI